MRGTFIRTLTEIAERDSRVLLLTGDLGYTVVEPFAETFPDRFFNVGVAEQNMVGLSTGLAEAGFIPFVYSIVTFASLRPYEFIRNGPIMHRLPVRIVAVGGGLEYGNAGASHHGVEDLGVMRIQPGMRVISPADYLQASAAVRASWDLPEPIYYRLGKDDKTEVPGLGGRFELGRTETIREGGDVVMLTTGSISGEAAAAAEELARRGVDCAVLVVASLNPPPVDDLVQALERFPVALTVEAHYVVGGLGSLVSEVVAERGLRPRVVRCGVTTLTDGFTGSERYLWEKHGLSRQALVQTALQALNGAGP